MLPKGHKVGTNPVFNGPQKSTAAKVGGAIASGAKAAGGAIAKGAAAAGNAAAKGAAAAGSGIAAGANRTAAIAKHPVVHAKAGVAQVKNSYTTALNDPRKSGPASTVASNIKNQPVKGSIKTAAAVTGALAPAAFAKGVANPRDAFKDRQNLREEKAEKKSGGLSWTPPKPGGRPRG